MSFSVLRFCLIAMVLAQPRAKKSKAKDEPAVEETAPVENTNSNQSMGPIGAGIGFCVLFAAVVVYLCRKDYLEKIEEKEKAEAEAKKLEEAAGEEEKPKPNPLLNGDADTHFNGVELASLTTMDASTPAGSKQQPEEVGAADRV